MAPPLETQELRTEVARYPWYHTLDLGGGVRTQGMFDHAPVRHRAMLPASMTGMRCLDVATMDGYWAFEMERRGAAEVVALDIEDPEALDWPVSIRGATVKTMDETKGTRFALAHAQLGSRVERRLLSVYDLGPELGTFDLVFCGDLLLHLKDPVTALERMRSVCSGSAIVYNPVRRFRFRERRAMAELDGIDGFTWWITNQAGLERMVRAAGFARAEAGPTFELPFRGRSDWQGLRGIVRASV